MKAEGEWPSIAIVTHCSEADLQRTLAGQLAVAERLGTELIAVDNASTDGTAALLRERAARSGALKLIEMPRNEGYATAANRAVAGAGERDVLLLNPDVELADARPVDALARALAERPRAGVVAPGLVGEDGSVQPSARRPASLAAMLGSVSGARLTPPLRRAYERYLAPSRSSRARSVGWVIGAAMLVRRKAFLDVGGFDEGFFLYMEDADLCRRLHRAGWEVVYLPEISLRHGYARASSAAGATLVGSPARRRHVASLTRYWRKHPRALVGGER